MKKVKTIMPTKVKVLEATVMFEMIIAWTCSKCGHANFNVGFRVPMIVDFPCSKCQHVDRIDARFVLLR